MRGKSWYPMRKERDSELMTYKEKLKQADREARAALVGLAATIIVWLLFGFGVAQTGVVVFSTPLWVFTGCLGTFACAIVVSLGRWQGASSKTSSSNRSSPSPMRGRAMAMQGNPLVLIPVVVFLAFSIGLALFVRIRATAIRRTGPSSPSTSSARAALAASCSP